MDSSYVSLVLLLMSVDGFELYRCDRNIIFGMDISTLLKIFKCVSNDDSIIIRVEDFGDIVLFVFESLSEYCFLFFDCLVDI